MNLLMLCMKLGFTLTKKSMAFYVHIILGLKSTQYFFGYQPGFFYSKKNNTLPNLTKQFIVWTANKTLTQSYQNNINLKNTLPLTYFLPLNLFQKQQLLFHTIAN